MGPTAFVLESLNWTQSDNSDYISVSERSIILKESMSHLEPYLHVFLWPTREGSPLYVLGIASDDSENHLYRSALLGSPAHLWRHVFNILGLQS